MPARRKRRPGSDRLYVSTDSGLPLGHLDLATRTEHDVPTAFRETFLVEANGWLWDNGMPPIAAAGSRDGAGPAAIEAGAPTPPGGWDPAWEDLALHLPGHGLGEEAARARATGGAGADRPFRLRADGQHAVADALGKLTREPVGTARLRRAPGRWRILHGVPMAFEGDEVLLDHLVLGPAGVFAIEVRNIPGGSVVVGAQSLEVEKEKVDLGRRRRIGEEVGRRISTGLARAAGAETTLNPPPVSPVIAIVGAVVVGGDRPRGVVVSRVGHLPRLLRAFGNNLADQAVDQTYALARRSDTWTDR